MKPEIIGTRFGGITFNERGNSVEYQRDVLVGLDGKVRKRKKKLSKQVYGTSHTVSLAEAEHIHEDGSEWLLVGTGMFGMLNLSDEAVDFFRAGQSDWAVSRGLLEEVMTVAVIVEPDAVCVGSRMQDLQFVECLAGRHRPATRGA